MNHIRIYRIRVDTIIAKYLIDFCTLFSNVSTLKLDYSLVSCRHRRGRRNRDIGNGNRHGGRDNRGLHRLGFFGRGLCRTCLTWLLRRSDNSRIFFLGGRIKRACFTSKGTISKNSLNLTTANSYQSIVLANIIISAFIYLFRALGVFKIDEGDISANTYVKS